MVTTEVEYIHEKTILSGYLAYQEGKERRPAVMVCHAWKGRDQFVCDKAVELAKDGYVGFAIDVYGKGVLGTSTEENTKLMSPFMENRTHLGERLRVAYDTIKKHPQVDPRRISAIGYCFGGLCAIDLVRDGVDLCGAVSFHGLLQPKGKPTATSTDTKILLLHGDADPMVSFESVGEFRKEMQTCGIDWQMHIYSNAKHSFTNPQANDHELGTVYEPTAAKHANDLMKIFLRDTFAKK